MAYYKNFDFASAKKLLKQALDEDLNKYGDITSNLLISKQSKSKAKLLIKENGIIAGLKIFELVFKLIDRKIKVEFSKDEGEFVKENEVIGYVEGNSRKLLIGERVALNILQRMSGIATKTHLMKQKLNNPSIKIIDTRKTTPNLRIFEKLAVKIGGGDNHRFGLYDMILIKDNHIFENGGIKETLKILSKNRKKIKSDIEIEVKNLNELKVVLENGKNFIKRVMVDNFSIPEIRKAIKINKGYFEIEVSGGINYSNIHKYKNLTGINYISIGSLTHSVHSLDISLKFLS